MFIMSKTFELITPESATYGDAEERGFEYKNKAFDSIEDMAEEIFYDGSVEPSSTQFHEGVWYTTIDPERNYRTGSETYYSFHPKLDAVDANKLHVLLTRKR